MRVVTLNQYGPPDVLVSHEVSCPAPGPGQVFIRTEAIGVNFRDTWIRSGTVPPPPGASLPLILGNEIGGTITEIGDDGDPSLVGDRVVASTGGSGGYAEYALTRADVAIAVPPRGVSVLGFGGQATLPGVQAGLVRESLELLAKGTLRPVIGQRFPLTEANKAHQAIETRETTGRTLLIPEAADAL